MLVFPPSSQQVAFQKVVKRHSLSEEPKFFIDATGVAEMYSLQKADPTSCLGAH